MDGRRSAAAAWELVADRRVPRTPVDLRREEREGGHAISRHVGRSNADLVRTLSAERLDTPGFPVFGEREGSFEDLPLPNIT